MEKDLDYLFEQSRKRGEYLEKIRHENIKVGEAYFLAYTDLVIHENEFDKVSFIKLLDFMKENNYLSNLAYDAIKSFIKNA